LQPNEEGEEHFNFMFTLIVGGVFQVYANEKLLWDRKTQGRFPEITELKRTVRDELVPEKNLGHADK
jgi:selenoprotein W-related protein